MNLLLLLRVMSPEIATAGIVILVVGYLYAGDFEKYSIFTVGVFQRVTHEPAALGCQTTTLAGHCLGIPRTNAVLGTWLFAAAAIGFHHWWLEVRGDA